MKIALLFLFLLFATPIVALAQPNFYYAEEYSASNSTGVSSSSIPSSDSCCSSGSGGDSSSSSGGSSSGSGGDGDCGGGVSLIESFGSCIGDIITLTGINGIATALNLSCPHSVGDGTRYVSCNGNNYVFKAEGFHYEAHVLSSHGSGSSYYAGWGLGSHFDCSCVADGASNRWDCGEMPLNYLCYLSDASITYFCSFTGVAVEGTPEPDACDARICSSNVGDVNKYNSESSSYCRDVGGVPSFRVVEHKGRYCSEGGCDCGSSGCSSSSEEPSSSSSDEPSSSSSDEPSSSSSDEPSSSSSEEPSSSSSEKPSSSSSSYELESSSSSEMSSDSNSGSGGDVCVASKPFLQKPANYYDDWVYIGKETYGSRHVSGSTKFSTKFFDVLGRAYDKMKANIKYYVFKEATENRHKVALEFEVYMKVIKGSNGNDVRVFVKEDKKNGLRRDSSFYWNGSWEVNEIDSLKRSIGFKSSLGIKIERQHDKHWRLVNKIITDKDGNTLVSEQYIWKNGKLIKTIFNNVERIFIYGKTLQETVKVVPSDEGLYFHPGYDNSVGMMLDESSPMYSFFALDPYGSVFAGYKKEKPDNDSKKSDLPVLRKSIKNLFSDCGITETPNMPKAQCLREEKTDISIDYNKKRYYPGDTTGATYGRSTFDFNIADFGCECKSDGFFHAFHSNNLVINEFIFVYFSAWKYNFFTANDWEESCWLKGDMRKTYSHESKHIENAREAAKWFFEIHMSQKYNTEKECLERSQTKIYLAYIGWLNWQDKEIMHNNVYPKSPANTGGRVHGDCD